MNDNAYIKTFTEGYDSDSNSLVERRTGKLKQGNRTLLLSATGGRLYYEELWDLSMMHIIDMTNHLPEAGSANLFHMMNKGAI